MTKFCGQKTGFNPKGSNDAAPNYMGPPSTKFSGRGGVPEGGLKNFPGPVTNADMGNRRLAKSAHGDGAGSSTSFSSSTAFGRGRK